MPANLENSAVATGLERSVLIPILKKDNAKECSNYHTIVLIYMLAKSCSKVSKWGFSRTKNFQMNNLDLEKAGELKIKLPTFAGS